MSFHRVAGSSIVAIAVALAAGCQRSPDELRPAPTVVMVPAPIDASTSFVSASSASAAPDSSAASIKQARKPACIQDLPARESAVPPPAAPGRCPVDPEGPSMLPIMSVRFDEAHTSVRAEIARASHDLEKGLMYRTKMDEDAGMLFKLGDRSEHHFWMHNTCIPLDMMFIDDDGTIVGIVENAPTLDDHERFVQCASSFVLEVNAGYSRRHGVRPGQHVALPI